MYFILCTADSRRGWCRLEQWARLNGGGLGGMYITRGEHVIEQIDEQVNLTGLALVW